jgi:hypothetical protein
MMPTWGAVVAWLLAVLVAESGVLIWQHLGAAGCP